MLASYWCYPLLIILCSDGLSSLMRFYFTSKMVSRHKRHNCVSKTFWDKSVAWFLRQSRICKLSNDCIFHIQLLFSATCFFSLWGERDVCRRVGIVYYPWSIVYCIQTVNNFHIEQYRTVWCKLFMYLFICSQNVTYKYIAMYKQRGQQGTDNRH